MRIIKIAEDNLWITVKDNFKDTYDNNCTDLIMELQNEWACKTDHIKNNDLAFTNV